MPGKEGGRWFQIGSATAARQPPQPQDAWAGVLPQPDDPVVSHHRPRRLSCPEPDKRTRKGTPVFAENLNTRLLATLERPDLRVVADHQRIVFDATLDSAFRADPEGQVVLGAACLGDERVCAFHIRHALELSMLLDAATRLASDGSEGAGVDLPILAGLCAARTAARFWLLDAAPGGAEAWPDPVSWLGPMAGASVPGAEALSVVWARIRHLQGSTYRLLRAERRGQDDSIVPDGVVRTLAACWEMLGPAETLMATGGDARLAVNPRTGLNHYGCSHRPRPWAVTFASSTASSLSERGFAGAETARKRVAIAALTGRLAEALVQETERVREAIAAHHGLADGPGIVLTASGTDSEMVALAVCCLPEATRALVRPVSNVLLAPEETGAGVPLAAAGRHFASDTARGRPVTKGDWIVGFPNDTRVLSVPIRDRDGRLLPPADVDAACIRLAQAEAGTGRTVLLHRLDLSKTGLLAPGLDCLETLQARLGERLEVVVDACQMRLDHRRVQDYIARGWMVMITGSKFFTGPPFCGALLLPARLVARLDGPGRLPVGLADYGSRVDWPPGMAAAVVDGPVNLGMVLRWQAALAEMAAFAQVPERLALERTAAFIAGVEDAIASSPHVAAVEVPAPLRPALAPAGGTCWDQMQTIRSFLVLAPDADGVRRPLDVARARLVYRWLNADVSRALPDAASDADRMLARLLCHIGQPAPVADNRLDDAMAGALRISVGARLLSGEPSHEGLAASVRMAREIADVRRILDKIDLLLRHWPALAILDPEPRFASDVPMPRRADPGLNI